MSRPNPEGGFALLAVMVAIVLLSALVVQFHFQSRVSLRLVTRQTELEQTRLAAGSGVTLARRLLQEDDAETDHLAETWALPLEFDWEELHWSIRIEDEGGKLGLGGLFELDVAEQERRERELRRLAVLLGQSEDFAPALLDWIDEDDLPRAGGAENLYYLSLGFAASNRAPDTVYEVYRVRHALAPRPEQRVAWEQVLSARPAEGEVNLNTASPEVLRSLSDRLDAGLAAAIVGRRTRRPFEKVVDLKQVPGLSGEVYNEIFDRVSVAGSRFRIESRAELRGTSSVVVAEVERGGAGTRLLYWSLR